MVNKFYYYKINTPEKEIFGLTYGTTFTEAVSNIEKEYPTIQKLSSLEAITGPAYCFEFEGTLTSENGTIYGS